MVAPFFLKISYSETRFIIQHQNNNTHTIPNMDKLNMKFTWGAILTLSEDYDIDFFKTMQDPLGAGIKGLIDIIFVGSKELNPDLDRTTLIDYLKSRGGTLGDELKYIFEEITKSLPSEEGGDDDAKK